MLEDIDISVVIAYVSHFEDKFLNEEILQEEYAEKILPENISKYTRVPLNIVTYVLDNYN